MTIALLVGSFWGQSRSCADVGASLFLSASQYAGVEASVEGLPGGLQRSIQKVLLGGCQGLLEGLSGRLSVPAHPFGDKGLQRRELSLQSFSK